MAMETPIVATDAGGTREVAEPGLHAVIVPVRDVRALRNAVDAALADPTAADVRARSARQRIARRLEAIYAELAEFRQPGHKQLARTAEARRA
jgi:L-malate glycosyltransferase